MSRNTIAKLVNTANELQAAGQEERAAILYRLASDLYEERGDGATAVWCRLQAARCDGIEV